jgi:hypothetical protein
MICMKKDNMLMSVVAICFVIFVSGCVSQSNELGACEGIKDPCALFECSVENCWCDDVGPDGPILFEDVTFNVKPDGEFSIRDALGVVINYLTENEMLNEYQHVETVKLNNYFYNVFMDNEDAEEIVYTVSHKGAILKIMCGV